MTTIIAECATAHGGDVRLAQDMIRQAAEAGAHLVKFQSYSKASINPSDPQAAWLIQAHLDRDAHVALMETCRWAGVQFLSTPFDRESLQMLRDLGQTTFKIASTESGNDWWDPRAGEQWIISWPWGRGRGIGAKNMHVLAHLTAIPLYPTPLEAVGRAELIGRPERGGWSDHCEGIKACQWALAQGIDVLEVHFTIPGARVKVWDKSAADVRLLRDFADAMTTIRSGVGQVFRDRWKRA